MGGISVAVALVLASVVQMVVGELMPKGFAIANPVGTAKVFAGPLRWFSLMLKPLIRLLDETGDSDPAAVPRRVQGGAGLGPVTRRAGILIRSSAEQLDLAEDEVRMLTRAVRFAGKTTLDVLVSRVDVVALVSTATVSELVASSRATGYSRFPVYGDGIDDVVGFVHVKDVLDIPPGDRRIDLPHHEPARGRARDP